jgi:hypothetical protein
MRIHSALQVYSWHNLSTSGRIAEFWTKDTPVHNAQFSSTCKKINSIFLLPSLAVPFSVSGGKKPVVVIEANASEFSIK